MLRNPVGIECLEDFALVLSTLLEASDLPPHRRMGCSRDVVMQYER